MKQQQQQATGLQSRVIKAKFFDSLGYSTVWEDEQVVERGLAPKAGDRVLSITSGGCFTLQFLLHDVADVISLDFNRNQNDLLALKIAAIKRLSHDDLWSFLGLEACKDRQDLYQALQGDLDPLVRERVDRRPQWIQQGITLVGKQDRYLHWVGGLIRRVQGERRVRDLLAQDDVVQQQKFYQEQWNTRRWRALCSLVFNRMVLHKAFDKEHFTHSQEKHPAQRLRLEVERALTRSPGAHNFYLHYLFQKTYSSNESCPAWLRTSNFATIHQRLDRIRIQTGSLEQILFSLPSQSIDCFNFSNLFDWVSRDHFCKLMQEVIRVARPGARLCYWTNAVNTRRELAWVGRPELQENEVLAKELSQVARTPGYSGCVLASVQK